MVRVPTNRIPTHPGEMLLEEFLTPMGITQKDLADNIEVPYQRINEIVNGRRGITPSTALRLAKFFDMSADFWMNLQLRWDLYFAQQDENKVLERIQPYSALNWQASLKVKSVPTQRAPDPCTSSRAIVVARRAHALRAIRQFVWLEVGSGKVAFSRPAHHYPEGAYPHPQGAAQGCYANANRWAKECAQQKQGESLWEKN